MSNKQRQSDYRQRQREAGLVFVSEWAYPEHRPLLRVIARALRESKGEKAQPRAAEGE